MHPLSPSIISPPKHTRDKNKRDIFIPLTYFDPQPKFCRRRRKEKNHKKAVHKPGYQFVRVPVAGSLEPSNRHLTWKEKEKGKKE
jgi:hypothetical protein